MGFRVTFVRHGQTDFNKDNLIHTSSDGTINETGRAQAETLGKFLKNEVFTKAYSSDLRRCQDTGKNVLAQIGPEAPEMVLDQRLRERDYGSWDGRPFTDIFKMAKEQNVPARELCAPDGETFEAALARIVSFFQDLLKLRDEGNDENIVVFTHGLMIQFLLKYLHDENGNGVTVEGLAYDPTKYAGNTSRSVLVIHEVKDGKRLIQVERQHDSGHL